MSTITLTWAITGVWLAQFNMVATLSIIYMNIISTVGLRLLLFSFSLWLLLVKLLWLLVYWKPLFASPFFKLNAGLR